MNWYVPFCTEYVLSTSYNWWCLPQVDHSWAEKGHYVACETGIRYPSLVAMLNSRSMRWRATVISHVMHVHISTYWVQTSTSQYVLSMYFDHLVMNRLMRRIARVMYTWTSTFWSQAELSLFTILHPCWPRQIHRHHHSGCSTYTGRHILSYVGCPPSWLSG